MRVAASGGPIVSAALWCRRRVANCIEGTKLLSHPVVGELELRYQSADLQDGNILEFYHAEPDSPRGSRPADRRHAPGETRAGGRHDHQVTGGDPAFPLQLVQGEERGRAAEVAVAVVLEDAAGGALGVDTNADLPHARLRSRGGTPTAAWRLDTHGNPIGRPRRFFYDLSGTAQHRDAQVRHALTRLLNWAKTCAVKAIAVEDLDFQAEKTREKHGRKRRFRQLISGMPTGKLRARLTSMADTTGIAIIAMDPACTGKWGAQHWQQPMTGPTRKTTRHDAAGIAIGRCAQGHPIRRRTPPPRAHQSDVHGHRTVQADRRAPGREGPRLRTPGPRTRSVPPDAASTRATRTPKTVRDVRSDQAWVQDSLLLTDQERWTGRA